jgi:CRP-like cAMP-binding protein
MMTLPSESLKFLSKLSPDQRRSWEAAPIPVVKDQVIVSPERDDRDVFYVVEGDFEATTESDKGKIVFYRAIGPGDLFGEFAAVDKGKRSATVTAITDGKVIRIPDDEFRQLIHTSFDAANWLILRQTMMMRELTDRLFEQIAYDVSTRVRAEILRLAEASGVVDNRARIVPVPTHDQLATRLGTTREAVTREMNHLGPPKPKSPNNLHLIERHGRELTVLNVAGLKRLLRTRVP